jgi:hypothetical protein
MEGNEDEHSCVWALGWQRGRTARVKKEKARGRERTSHVVGLGREGCKWLVNVDRN